MKVSEMIEALKKLPQDADIFEGVFYPRGDLDAPLVELYDREPVYYPKVWGCGSGAPWKLGVHKNVVILEDT